MSSTFLSSRSFAVGMALGAGLLWNQAAFAQFGRGADFRANVSLEVNTEVVKRLATVEDHVKERQWGQAILILEQVAAEHGNTMIALSPRRFLNVGVYCNSILANFPPEGLVVYREKQDAQAKQWLEAGLLSRNPLMLEKIVRQAFVTSSGDEALYWLGEWAWDRGNFSAARDHWRQLLKLPNPPEAGEPQTVLRYPDSSYPQGVVVARIVLSHIMEGNRDLAKNWLGYLAKQYPESRGDLAGRNGLFTEILSEVLKESESWQFPTHSGDMPTFAGNSQRNFIHPKAPDIGGVQWERPLPETESPRGEREASLSYYPIVQGQTIYFCDPYRIYALDALTGEPRWPRPTETLPPEAQELDKAVIYESAIGPSGRESFRVGVPRFTLTVHEDRLYARMGSPVTGRLSPNVSTEGGSAESELVCLDLAQEGKVTWTATPAKLLAGEKPETWPQWAFEGAPVVEGGRVFVALRHSEAKAIVACLDAETGQPQWSRRAGSAVSGLGERQKFISHFLVTSGENMVFYMPEFGVVTGFDAQDGRLLWAVTYPSFSPKDSPVLGEPRRQGLTPCVFHRGVVYAAPTDSESVLAISAKTGVLLWERQIPIDQDQIRNVLGVVNDRLVLSGNSLWILNAATGAVISPAHVAPGRAPEFDGYGRGLIAGETVFFPTRSTIEIRGLDGQRTKQPEPFPGGNLAIAGDLLLVAEPRRLVAYGNLARIKQKQQELISKDPNAALPLLRLARTEEASGRHQAALDLYEEAQTKATPQDILAGQSLAVIAGEHRYKLLMRLGSQAMEQGLPRHAIGHFEEAAGASANTDARAQAMKGLGTAQLQTNQTAEALESFQKILEEPALSDEALRTFAKDQIALLIQKHGRGVYAKVEARAEEELADRIQAQDFQGVENILRRYPHAMIAAEAKYRLAWFKKDKGDSWQAIQLMREILEEPAPAAIRQAALFELALALEQKRYLRPARTFWEQLRREFPAAVLPLETGPKSASLFIDTHLKSQKYRRLEPPVPLLPFARRWELALEQKAQVILPEGEPPGVLLDSVLLEDRGLTAVNVSTGQTRWRKPVDDLALWAAYGPMQLVIGTEHSLLAVALETGQTLWQTALRDPDEEGVPPRFQLAGERVLVLSPEAVSSYDANTGRLIWQTAAKGRFGPLWHADEEFIIVQNENSRRVWVLDTFSGRRLSEHRPRGAWITSPVPFRSPPPGSLKGTLATNRGFIAAMENGGIHAFGAYDPQADPAWTYQGATSLANAPPWFCSEGQNLVMLMDGDTLISLEPDTGEPKWFTFASPSPLTSPGGSILLDTDRIYAAGDGRLSCLDLKNGKALWKAPVPEGSAWLLRETKSMVMAVPHRFDDSKSQAILFDAKTGSRIQTLNLPPKVTDVLLRPEGFLAIAEGKLRGFGPREFSPGPN